jgi:hypothetical protein
MTSFYFNCDDADIFDDEGTNLMRIEAETQAEAEAKILAEPRLVGLSTIDGFDLSFRTEVSDRYFRAHQDDSMEWLTVTQVILTERKHERAKLASTNGDLLAALIDRNGDLPPVRDGVCSVCGREYFGNDIPEDGMCPSDDCPHTIARAAIAKARGTG